MSKAVALSIGVALVILLLLFSMTYTVSFHEVAIKTTFGKSSENDVISEPGLKFKLPIFADRVKTFDTRLQLMSSPDQEVQTADGQTVVVRAFLLWRIDAENVRAFDRSYSSLSDARPYLRDQFLDALGALSRYSFDDLIGSDSKLAEAEEAVRARLEALENRGIVPVKVGLSQLRLPPQTTIAVVARMKATRESRANAERSTGASLAETIRVEAENNAERILTFAEQRAADIRAQGNERAAEYLEQMGEDEQLAIFLTWVDALEQSLRGAVTFVLDPQHAPAHLMNLDAPRDPGTGMPLPGDMIQGGAAAADDGADDEEDVGVNDESAAEIPGGAAGVE